MKLSAITWNVASVDDRSFVSVGRGARLLRTTESRRLDAAPLTQLKAQADIGDKLTAMIKNAAAWKLSVQFEDESFEPVISHNTTKK